MFAVSGHRFERLGTAIALVVAPLSVKPQVGGRDLEVNQLLVGRRESVGTARARVFGQL